MADAHRLAAEGQLRYGENPLLGLRLEIEGWSLFPQYNSLFEQHIRDMTRDGHIEVLNLQEEGNISVNPGQTASTSDKLSEDTNGLSLPKISSRLVSNVPNHTYYSSEHHYVVVSYNNNRPGELRRTKGNLLVTELSTSISYAAFGPEDEYFLVDYNDNRPGELRRTVDGSLITELPDSVSYATLSSNNNYVVIGYSDNRPGKLRRTDDGSLITELPDPVSYAVFSPDNKYFVVSYSGLFGKTPGKLCRTDDGSLITELPDPVSYAVFSPDNKYFVVSYNDLFRKTPGELRRTVDNSFMITLSGSPSNVTFSLHPPTTYFVVTYEHASAELWEIQDIMPRRLVILGSDLEEYSFNSDNSQLVTWYVDKRAYRLDLVWLRAMRGQAETMSIGELVRIACEGPFASDLFDEAELKPYLAGREPQACQK